MADGDAERVVGALTAVESFVEATDVEDPVRRAFAARRGRGADVGTPF